MLELPSKGSIMTTYFPALPSSPHRMCWSCSSEPIPATDLPAVKMRMKVRSAKTSNFCCASSWVFRDPDWPKMPASPARLTWWLTIFAATPMSVSSRVSWPDTNGNSACASMMNSWRVIAFDMGWICSFQNHGQDRGEGALARLQAAGQIHKALGRKLLRAQPQGRFVQPVDGKSSGAQGIAQSLAALVEGGFGYAL